MTQLSSLKKLYQTFDPQHFHSAILMPGSVFLGLSLVFGGALLLGGILLATTGLLPLAGWTGMMILGFLVPVLGLLAFGALVVYLGHLWHLTGLIQTANTDTRETPIVYWNSFVRGLHLVGYGVIVLFAMGLVSHAMEHLTGYQAQAALIESPVAGDFQSVTYDHSDEQYISLFMRLFQSILAELILFTILFPFILAPIFYQAQHPSLLSMLKHLVPSWRWMLSRYPQVLGVTTCVFSLMLIGTTVCILLLSFTGFGLLLIPFLFVGVIYLMTVFLTRAYPPSPYLAAFQSVPAEENNIKNL